MVGIHIKRITAWQEKTKFLISAWFHGNDVQTQLSSSTPLTKRRECFNQRCFFTNATTAAGKRTSIWRQCDAAGTYKVARRKEQDRYDDRQLLLRTTRFWYLAKVIQQAKNIGAKQSRVFIIHFLFAMQYENGGFPRYFPLKKDYSRHITYNDNAQ
ncbi:MAG: hypothetical protein IPG58_16600 [Acidobacteria bacterium]|nr:hypothetical protein [Acidobacteriota bacterium]